MLVECQGRRSYVVYLTSYCMFVFIFDIINTTFHLQRWFCSNLGMTNQAVKAAQEAVQKSEELDIRRSPISVAAAIIYMITQLSDDKKLLKDISVATGVAEGTIRN